jgi:hypothetical protein
MRRSSSSNGSSREAGGGGGGGGHPLPTPPPPPPPPRLVLNENDYCFGDLKVAGNAQAITGGRALHHTSFLWDWKPEHMRLLLPPQKQPEYRRRRSHGAFLGSVAAAGFPASQFPLGAESLARALERAVAHEWRGQGVEEADPEELRRALAGKHLRGNRWVDLRRELELAGGVGGGGGGGGERR